VRGCCETLAADLLASRSRPVLTNVGEPTQLSATPCCGTLLPQDRLVSLAAALLEHITSAGDGDGDAAAG